MQKVIENQRKTNRRGSVFPVLFFLGSLLLSGCNASRDSICRDFPSVADEINGIQTEIAALDVRADPKKAGKGSRRIASVSPITATPEETRVRREAWMVWGEKALKRTQWAKDALEDDQRGRKAVPALNDAGLSLVSFHGFLDQEKWRKAYSELDRVEKSLTRARKIACDAEALPSKKTAAPAPQEPRKHGKKKVN